MTVPSPVDRHIKPFVLETTTTRALQFSASEIQSRMNLREPQTLALEYTRTMMGFLAWHAAPAQLVMIGLGGGSIAKFCHAELPHSRLDVVEINPHVIALRDRFCLPPDDARLRVVAGDGAQFVHDAPDSTDVLLVDGFDVHGLPIELSSQRFYDDCAAALRPGGLLVANLHAGHADFVAQVERIRRSLGPALLTVLDADRSNCVVFARRGDDLSKLRRGALRRPAGFSALAWRAVLPVILRVAAAADGLQTGRS